MKTKVKSFILLGLFLTLPGLSFAQKEKEQLLSSTIEKVVVYFQGAFIYRTTPKEDFSTGRHQVVLKNLSPYLESKAVKVKAASGVTILSVEHRRDFLGERTYRDTLNQLLESQKEIREELSLLKLQDSLLLGRRKFLEQNRVVGGENNGLSLEELEKVYTFYASQMETMRTEQLNLRKESEKLRERLKRLQAQAYEFQKEYEFIPSDLVITFETKRSLSSVFEVNYLVSNASWVPSYDLRVENIEQPVQLVQKAAIYQSTGEDWENVKLLLSNDNPLTESDYQEIGPQYLSLQYRNSITYGANRYDAKPVLGVRFVSGYILDGETGEPLIGATILVKGTGMGTVTDFDGFFSLSNLPYGSEYLEVSYVGYSSQTVAITGNQLNATMLEPGVVLESAVVVTGNVRGLSSKKRKDKYDNEGLGVNTQVSKVLENQTSFQIELEVPYTIHSNGKGYNVNVRNLEIEAEYVYQSVPKLQEKAYLFANLIDWSDYNLLQGAVNLFYEDTYIGESNIDFQYITDTLQVSLDADESIQVSHEKVKELRKRRIIGNKRLDNFVYEIQLRNGKKEAIQLELKDQIPVSKEKEIEITLESLEGGGQLNEETGIITWDINLQPGERQTIRFEYTVKYPKNRTLYGNN